MKFLDLESQRQKSVLFPKTISHKTKGTPHKGK